MVIVVGVEQMTKTIEEQALLHVLDRHGNTYWDDWFSGDGGWTGAHTCSCGHAFDPANLPRMDLDLRSPLHRALREHQLDQFNEYVQFGGVK